MIPLAHKYSVINITAQSLAWETDSLEFRPWWCPLPCISSMWSNPSQNPVAHKHDEKDPNTEGKTSKAPVAPAVCKRLAEEQHLPRRPQDKNITAGHRSSHLLICTLLVSLCVQELYNCPKKFHRDWNVAWSLMHSRVDDYSQASTYSICNITAQSLARETSCFGFRLA